MALSPLLPRQAAELRCVGRARALSPSSSIAAALLVRWAQQVPQARSRQAGRQVPQARSRQAGRQVPQARSRQAGRQVPQVRSRQAEQGRRARSRQAGQVPAGLALVLQGIRPRESRRQHSTQVELVKVARNCHFQASGHQDDGGDREREFACLKLSLSLTSEEQKIRPTCSTMPEPEMIFNPSPMS